MSKTPINNILYDFLIYKLFRKNNKWSISNRKLLLFDIDFYKFVNRFLFENGNQIFFFTYLKKLKNDSKKNCTRMKILLEYILRFG